MSIHQQAPSTLIVDDERHIRELLTLMLENMGCRIVAEVGNGDTVMEACEQYQPQLILMDINMPGKNGDSLVAEIKAKLPNCVVIMMTSVNDKGTITQCLKSGAKNYILKGTDLEKMQGIIESTWNKHGVALSL